MFTFAVMKRLPVIICIFVAFVAGVTGCDSMRRYDARLAAADSLMRSAPDSALAIVQVLTADSLASEGDRAYHDLLLTQARYRCYITATSDSDINRALAYYRAHSGEREKLTRALIYKGAVMEEFSHPDSAMLYYKQAEANADPDDYFNLGYSKMRMATLYQDQLSQDSAAINRLRQAIKCFEMVNDTNYLISCYGQLGGICGLKTPDSTEYYLKRAIMLAKLSNSTKQYTYKSKLAGFYLYYYEDYQRAKELAMDVMLNGKSFSKERQFYYYAALSYVRLGMLDSAIYVFDAIPAPVDAVDSMNNYQVEAEINKAKKDLIAYHLNLTRSREEEIRIRVNNKDTKLKVAEVDYDMMQTEQHMAETKRSNRHLAYALCITIIFIIILTWLVIHLRVMANNNLNKIRAIEGLLSDNIKELEEKKKLLDQKQSTISELFGYRISALNELFERIRFESKGNKNHRIRSVVPLSSVIMDLNEIYHVMKIDLSDNFWDNMKRSVDAEYKGIASHVEENYPDLSTKEKRLFYLLCAKVPPQIVKLCLGYTNVKSVSNSINIIIKKKMGFDTSLDEFIDKYMKNEL